jgi:hypothetical protein
VSNKIINVFAEARKVAAALPGAFTESGGERGGAAAGAERIRFHRSQLALWNFNGTTENLVIRAPGWLSWQQQCKLDRLFLQASCLKMIFLTCSLHYYDNEVPI